MAAAKEARRKVEVEATRLEVEQTSLLLDIRLRTKCLLSNLRRAKTKRPWRKTTRRPYS